MDQLRAQHGARPEQLRGDERRAAIDQHRLAGRRAPSAPGRNAASRPKTSSPVTHRQPTSSRLWSSMNANSTARRPVASELRAVQAVAGPQLVRRGRLEAAVDLARRAPVGTVIEPGARQMRLQRARARDRLAGGGHDRVDLRRRAIRTLALERDRQLEDPRRRPRHHRPRPRAPTPHSRPRGRRGSSHPTSCGRPVIGRPSGPVCSRAASSRTSRPRSALATTTGRPAREPACSGTGRPRVATPPARVRLVISTWARTLPAHGSAGKGQLVWHNNAAARQHGDHRPHLARPEPQHERARRHRDHRDRVREHAARRRAPAPSSGSSANAHREKCARIASASRANRRSQPRTVSFGTPSRSAIGRCPAPAALAASAAPITATASRRRSKHSSGNKHVRPGARAALRAPRPQPPDAADHTLARVPPRTQRSLAGRAPQRPRPSARPRPSPPRRIPSPPGATSGIQESPPGRTDQARGRALARLRTREAFPTPRTPSRPSTAQPSRPSTAPRRCRSSTARASLRVPNFSCVQQPSPSPDRLGSLSSRPQAVA